MSWSKLKVSEIRALAQEADLRLIDHAVLQSGYPGTRLADAESVVKAAGFAIVGDALRRIADAVEGGR